MKKAVITFAMALTLTANVLAQTIQKVKTKVEFKNLGNYTTITTTRIEGEKMRTDSDNEFKGHGVLKNTMAKLFLKSGSIGEITDLPAMKIYKMDLKMKTYTVETIKPVTFDEQQQNTSVHETSSEINNEESEKEKESNIKIIRREFKVEDTGQKKNINNFDCNRYTILWLVEWQNTETKEQETDSLFTTVWATPKTGQIERVNQEKNSFDSAYMKKLGLNIDEPNKELLGLQWIQMMNNMNKSNDQSVQEMKTEFEKLNKIKGIPIVIDGNYFTIRPDKKGKSAEQKEERTTNVRKIFGRFARKVIKKKLNGTKQTGPDLHFYTEILKYGEGNFGESIFKVPSDYKKK